MTMNSFDNKKIAVLGAGKEGLAMAMWLAERRATVDVRDKDASKQIDLPNTNGITHHFGPDYLDDLEQFDLVVRSPGIPWLTPELERARKLGVTITSQTELFLQRCPAKVIGVTGTKGKSTTASLIFHILQTAGRKVRLAGNIGTVMINWLDELNEDETVILEMSSFQLQGLTVSPHISVVLDITQDHLDHHRNKAEYISAKQTIMEHQWQSDFAVLNADSLVVTALAGITQAKTYWFSSHKFVDQGAHVKEIDGKHWLVVQDGFDDPVERAITPVDGLPLKGEHNWTNMAAACSVGLIENISVEHMQKALQTFNGLPHRLQEISQAKKRLWVDDAVSTAPESTIAALKAYDGNPVVVVIGGRSKGQPYDELVEYLLAYPPKATLLIGEVGVVLQPQLAQLPNVELISSTSNMHDIINSALTASRPGDTILFSPGCASFDMFKNVYDRADQFVAAVKSLGK